MLSLVSGVLLTLASGYLYQTDSSWLVNGALPLFAGVLLVIQRRDCPVWRLCLSLCIVLGTVQTVFFCWSIRQVERASFVNRSALSDLSKDVLIPAISTCFAISSSFRRKSTYNNYSLTSLFRSFTLLSISIGMLSAIAFTGCINFPSIPYCSVFH